MNKLKNKLTKLTMVTLLLIGLSGLRPASAQIQNGGFETGDFTGWPTINSATVTSSESHWGSYSVEMGDDEESWVRSKTYSIDSDDIDFIDVWLKHPILSGSHYINIIINFEDDVDIYELNDIYSGWHRHRFVNIPSDDIFKYIIINPHGDFTTRSLFVDDVGIYYTCIPPYC